MSELEREVEEVGREKETGWGGHTAQLVITHTQPGQKNIVLSVTEAATRV